MKPTSRASDWAWRRCGRLTWGSGEELSSSPLLNDNKAREPSDRRCPGFLFSLSESDHQDSFSFCLKNKKAYSHLETDSSSTFQKSCHALPLLLKTSPCLLVFWQYSFSQIASSYLWAVRSTLCRPVSSALCCFAGISRVQHPLLPKNVCWCWAIRSMLSTVCFFNHRFNQTATKAASGREHEDITFLT